MQTMLAVSTIKLRTTGSFGNTKMFYPFQLENFTQSTTVKTLNIGTPRLATIVVLNIKQFNFTMK